MTTRVRRRTPDRPDQRQHQAPARSDDPAPLIPVLARRVREVESRVTAKGKATPTNRTKFQVIALLMRAERARVKDDTSIPSAARAAQLKRLNSCKGRSCNLTP